jgi:hypothetical protein
MLTLDVSSVSSSEYRNYRSKVHNPLVPSKGHIPDDLLEQKAREIFEWAQINGALYFSFFAYPSNEGILEKQETFLDLRYFFKDSL